MLTLVRWFIKKVTFGEIARQIIEQKRLRAPGTYAAAQFRLGRLIRHFDAIPISDFNETHWQNFIANRWKEAPGCRFFDDKKYLQQVILEAHRRGVIERQLRLTIPDLPSTAGKEISPAEVRRLFKYAGPNLRFQMEIAYKMGLRLREMLYLRWDQFNWERNTIKFLPRDTKTRRGREVPLNPDLIRQFRKRYLQRKSIYVFPKRGDALKPQHENKTAWKLCRKKAGVCARWHDWRHTAASTMLRRGNSPQAVRKYLGMSEEVLTKIYHHLNLDDLRLVARRMSQKRQ